jgi:serine/threonine-protein kinase HipA
VTRLVVYVDLDGQTCPLGERHLNLRRGRLSSTFAYGADYLARPGAYAIDPELPLTGGNWPSSRPLPRAFGDAAPDRWGRNLIAKRALAEAAETGTPMRHLDDSDYLLGVSDIARHGALRFKTEPNGTFCHPAPEVPKLLALPELMRAADAVARDDANDLSAVKTLLDAGTASLGGARPKASVADDDRLLIAKFPHPSDRWDVVGWEKTALDLASAVGIAVPTTQLLNLEGSSVLLLDRFDRDGASRIGYISALTLLEAEDGVRRDYLEIAEALAAISSEADADLAELWRRVAFSVAINNTDDHLRNHGFLRTKSGWRLAPAFDLNPNPEAPGGHVTTIAGSSNPGTDVDALLAHAENFGLTQKRATAILHEVAAAAADWPAAARHQGIPASEIARFTPTLTLTLAALRRHPRT